MIGKKFCPNCGSEEVVMVAGGITGAWMCKECSYSGSIFPEQPLIGAGRIIKEELDEQEEESMELDEALFGKAKKKSKVKKLKPKRRKK